MPRTQDAAPENTLSDKPAFKHLQVRLSADEARRFKHAAENHGHSVQSGLVTAINALLKSWKEKPVTDPGSAGKTKPSE
jgi:hypothetical protein